MSPQPNDEQAQVIQWIESTLEARVVACERQARWRPAWFLVAERGPERLRLYFRGDRGLQQGGQYALEHEYRILELLGQAGIPVPTLYGFCDSPRGILMEQVAGRANLATATDESERSSVQDHYMQILADIHALDTEPFESAGLVRPTSKTQMALADFPIWERGYAQAKARPDALLAFVSQWLHRNVPETDAAPSFVCADSGQFLFDQGRVTAVIDLELAHLGDPAADLAGLRTRDLSEPLGDLRRATHRYAELRGIHLDPRLIDYHTVRFSIVTPLAIAPILSRPPPETDWVQYLCWYWVYARAALEVMAHMTNVPLDPPEPIEATISRYSPGYKVLSRSLAQDREGDDFDRYRIEKDARQAEYLRRVDLRAPELEQVDRSELVELTGQTATDWLTAEESLETFVADAGPERDADLIRFFHRRTARHDDLLSPVMRELQNSQIQMLDT